MVTIALSGRRFGKTAAAALAAGMSMDEYRELMRQQHERIESEAKLNQISSYAIRGQEAYRRWRAIPTLTCSERFWLDMVDERQSSGADYFQKEWLCQFAPELTGPPPPTYEQWEQKQRADANEERWKRLGLRGYRWEFSRREWDR